MPPGLPLAEVRALEELEEEDASSCYMVDLGEERDRRMRALEAALGEAVLLEVIDAGLREMERARAS